jgi:hypothetical protein
MHIGDTSGKQKAVTECEERRNHLRSNRRLKQWEDERCHPETYQGVDVRWGDTHYAAGFTPLNR